MSRKEAPWPADGQEVLKEGVGQMATSRIVRSSRQSGMASMIITLITMIVITLIVLGFAAISRREQRQTLDQQLSSQAFYAAESAVEDARGVIMGRLQSGLLPVGRNSCTTNDVAGGDYPTGTEMVLDAANSVAYTCLTVDTSPTSITFDGVGQDNVVMPIRPSANASSIDIEWRPSTPPASATPAGCPSGTANVFASQPTWTAGCGYAVLRAELVPVDGALTSAGLSANTFHAVFVPQRVGGSTSYPYSGRTNQPNIVGTRCDTPSYGSCSIRISGLGSSINYVLRLSSLYSTSNIRVAAMQGSSPLELSGAQAVIDATGKAQDVLRRVQVRLPVSAGGNLTPSEAVRTNGSLCKRFDASPGYTKIADDIVEPDTSNPMCLTATTP